MYCAEFTAVYDKLNFPDRILFAKQKYDRYVNNKLYDKIYVQKFYMNKNNEICFKYLKFGRTTEEKGFYNNLVYKKRRTYKLNNDCKLYMLEDDMITINSYLNFLETIKNK